MKENVPSAQLQKEFRKLMQERLLPWARGDLSQRLILGQLPLRAPPGIRVEPYALPPLRSQDAAHSYFTQNLWETIEMVAGRYPAVAVVLDGQADMRIGAVADDLPEVTKFTPESTARLLPALAEGTFLVFPAGVPHDSNSAHWHRPHPENAASRIFWMQFQPEGVRCHTCSTRGLSHSARGWVLCHDTRVLGLAELLIEELAADRLHSITLARNHLLTLLLRAHRGLTARAEPAVWHREFYPDRKGVDAPLATSFAPDSTFARACGYIQSHLQEELSVASIARHVFVSSFTLNRIFNAEASLSVMRYVARQRMKSAQFYLEHSSIPISEIGRLVGYDVVTKFSRAFRLSAGQTPRAFRDSRNKCGAPAKPRS